MLKKMLYTTLVVLFITTGVFANELNVYPIPAVFTSKNISDSAFNKVLKDNRAEFTKEYLTLFDKYFPNANKEISDKTKYKTFAAYIHVPRASQYKISKMDNKLLDIYLPLTMSIGFVNMATGETLYSYQETKYSIYPTTVEGDIEKRKEKISQMLKENYNETMKSVIKNACENFKPFDITTKLSDTYRSYYVFDKGVETGITKGDLLTDANVNQVSVIYSDLGYSVAKKVLGNPSTDSEFSKFANSNITQLKKPKILFINDFNDEKFYNIFSSALGNSASFSLITTDKTYFDMQTALVSLNMDFRSKNTYNRTLPDYFLKLYFTKPAYAQYKSNKEYFNVDKYEMLVCAVIFDKAGRVVYSNCVTEEEKENILDNVRFKDYEKFEIITKNILLTLAETMQKDIKFKNVKFKIKKTDNEYLTIADSNGFLKTGNILTVFKKIKTEKAGKEILIPTWDYRVITSENGLAECKMSKPYLDGIDYPSKTDIIKMSAMTRSANKANMFNYNPDKVAIDGNEVELKAFDKIVFAALSSTLKAPITMPAGDFQEQIKDLNALGFKENIEIPENDGNTTIKAVYKVTLNSEETKGNVFKREYNIIVGIVSKKDEELIKKEGMQQTVTLYVPKENNEDIVQIELLKYIYPLIQQIASKF